jgi:hypothetical protein
MSLAESLARFAETDGISFEHLRALEVRLAKSEAIHPPVLAGLHSPTPYKRHPPRMSAAFPSVSVPGAEPGAEVNRAQTKGEPQKEPAFLVAKRSAC